MILGYRGNNIIPKDEVLDSTDFDGLNDLQRIYKDIQEGDEIYMTNKAWKKYGSLLEPMPNAVHNHKRNVKIMQEKNEGIE